MKKKFVATKVGKTSLLKMWAEKSLLKELMKNMLPANGNNGDVQNREGIRQNL